MSEYGEQQATFFVEGLEELDGFITKLREMDDCDDDFFDESPQTVRRRNHARTKGSIRP